MNKLLFVDNVHKKFIESSFYVHILKGATLSIGLGEMVALMGVSGSGKSTLLQLIGGLDVPTSGQILFQGKALDVDESSTSLHRQQHVGFVFQKPHLLAELTVLENIMLPLLVSDTSKITAVHEAGLMLDDLGLSDRKNYDVTRLSGGEQQRVAIGRALVRSPLLLLADEPTGNLDTHTAQSVFDLFLKLCRKRKQAMLMVTHNESLARQMDRQLSLENGMIIEKWSHAR